MSPKQHTLDISYFSAIQTWLIDPEVRDLLLAQLLDKGQIVLSYEEDPIHYTDWNYAYYSPAPQKNSVAVLSIKGVIYDYYADYLASKIYQMYTDKNVVGAVFRVNSPGGSADAGYKIADAISAAPWDTWGYIDYGQANSAGYLIGAATDGMSASRPLDRVGSIGAYTSYQDATKYWEKLGIVSKDIYAKQSTEKNQEVREAAKGNFKLLEEAVSAQAQAFIDYVQARRPNLDTSTMDPFKGKVFSASDALKIGLIDSIGTLAEAVKHVKTASSNTNTTPRTNMLGFVKSPALLALKGVEASAITEAQVEAVKTDLAALGITGIAVCASAEYEKAIEAMNAAPTDSTALTTAQADVTRLTTELTAEKTKATSLATELATAKTEITRLGGLNGAERTQLQQQNEQQVDKGDEANLIANLPHNKALEGNPLFN